MHNDYQVVAKVYSNSREFGTIGKPAPKKLEFRYAKLKKLGPKAKSNLRNLSIVVILDPPK